MARFTSGPPLWAALPFSVLTPTDQMAGLYLHIPFCSQKCSYCDFFSAPPVGNQLDTWHHLLVSNLRLIAAEQPTKLDTIFFGGGTPSLLSPAQIETILDACRILFILDPQIEISLEANPATLTRATLDAYLALGINRLSLGIQSFNDQFLRFLGRKHCATQAVSMFKQARTAGFNNLSLDLIFALPGQTSHDLEQEISQVLELNPEHVGIYGLSIEPGTPLQHRVDQKQVREIDEELYAQSYLLLDQRLTEAGFEHYEISNFARPGYRCQHNQAYWQRKTCLAAGAGAHGFDASNYGRRFAIPADLIHYQQKLAAQQNPAELVEEFTRRQAMSETLYLALRSRDGINNTDFINQFGLSPKAAFPKAFERLRPSLQHQADRWFFTVDSWLLYDHLISDILTP